MSKIVPLLEAVAAADDDGISVREISRRIGIDKSAVSRLFKQLEELDMVEQSPVSGRYSVGPRLFSLGEILHTRSSLWRAAEPVLHKLVEQFDETCYLVMREFNRARFQERIDCKQLIRYVIDLGQVSPLHAGAAGRAILAGMPQADVDHYLATATLTAVAPDTVTSESTLLRLVHEDRARGYSVSAGERVRGGRGIAAPVFRADGHCVGSLLWTCPQERFDRSMVPEVGAAVRAASQELSRRLGYAADPPADQ